MVVCPLIDGGPRCRLCRLGIRAQLLRSGEELLILNRKMKANAAADAAACLAALAAESGASAQGEVFAGDELVRL